jgi:hypothetical protein
MAGAARDAKGLIGPGLADGRAEGFVAAGLLRPAPRKNFDFGGIFEGNGRLAGKNVMWSAWPRCLGG